MRRPRASSRSRSCRQLERVLEEDDVVAPRAQEQGLVHRARMGAEDGERPVTDFVGVAVGAVQQILAPPFTHAGDVGQFVAQPGRDQDAAGLEHGPADHADVVAVVDLVHPSLDEPHAVPGDLGMAEFEQCRGGQPVAGQEAVHVRGGRVARLAGVYHHHLAAGPSKKQGGVQPGRSGADHHHVENPVVVGGARCAAVRVVRLLDHGDHLRARWCASWW